MADYPGLTKALFTKLVAATKVANQLPEGGEFKYHECFPEFKSQTAGFSSRLLSIVQGLADQHNTDGLKVDPNDDGSDGLEAVTDLVDSLLEQADAALDEAAGKRAATAAAGSGLTRSMMVRGGDDEVR